MPGYSRHSSTSSPDPIIRAAAIGLLLDRLDANDDKRFRNRRSGDRIRFRSLDLGARIHHPGGSSASILVSARNISVSGVGLLVGRFLHTGTVVELTLPRMLDGATDLVIGKVVFCTHVGGTMHQVGVRFNAKIFPALYVDVPAAEVA